MNNNFPIVVYNISDSLSNIIAINTEQKPEL